VGSRSRKRFASPEKGVNRERRGREECRRGGAGGSLIGVARQKAVVRRGNGSRAGKRGPSGVGAVPIGSAWRGEVFRRREGRRRSQEEGPRSAAGRA